MKDKEIVLVVEGRQDEQFIRSFLDVEIVITNGTSVPRGTIDYLKSIQNKKHIVVLTDPDYPGMYIRQEIAKYVENFDNVYIDKRFAIKKDKVGVAESSKEVVLEALKHYSRLVLTEKNNFNMQDLYRLGLVGCDGAAKKRNYISSHFHLGYNNAKTLLRKLNANDISVDAVNEALSRYEEDENRG